MLVVVDVLLVQVCVVALKISQFTHFLVYILKYRLLGHPIQLVPSKYGANNGQVKTYPLFWLVLCICWSTCWIVLLFPVTQFVDNKFVIFVVFNDCTCVPPVANISFWIVCAAATAELASGIKYGVIVEFDIELTVWLNAFVLVTIFDDNVVIYCWEVPI